jgi:hypothetical protein
MATMAGGDARKSVHTLTKSLVMNYQLIAKIRGTLCQECTLPFHQSILRAYHVQEEPATQGGGIVRNAVGEVKAQDLEALSPHALGRVTLNADGQGELLIHDKAAYNGGGLLLILEVPFLEGMESPESRHPARYLSLGTVSPAWEIKDRDSFHAPFSTCLPERIVLLLLEYFGLWIISGKVNVCDAQGKTIGPAPGLTVTAMDNDLIQDDDLGSATSDSQGHFRIAYRSRDFKRTPFSPAINTETLGGAGPDLYFIVKAGSNVRLRENPERGLQPDRKDVGRIACVQLCIPGTYDGRATSSAWTRIGYYQISTEGALKAFDGAGFLLPGGTEEKWAITGTIGLMGLQPYPLGSQQEYRFLYATTTGDNTQPALDASLFKPVKADDGIFVADQIVGVLKANLPAPFEYIPVNLRSNHLDSEGWVNLRQAVEDALDATKGFSAANLNNSEEAWYFSGNSALMHIDTKPLSKGRKSVPLQANVLYDGPPIPVEKIALRFEVREKGGGTPGQNNGTTLNAMVINNDAMSIDISMGKEECAIFRIGEPVQLGYSLFHPYLHHTTVEIKKGRSNYEPCGPVPIVPAGSDRAAGQVDLKSFLKEPCTYTVRMHWSLRLTNGVDNIGGHEEVQFYSEG